MIATTTDMAAGFWSMDNLVLPKEVAIRVSAERWAPPEPVSLPRAPLESQGERSAVSRATHRQQHALAKDKIARTRTAGPASGAAGMRVGAERERRVGMVARPVTCLGQPAGPYPLGAGLAGVALAPSGPATGLPRRRPRRIR